MTVEFDRRLWTLADRVLGANYKTYSENIRRYFQFIDESEELVILYRRLTHDLNFDRWYEDAKGTMGGMVGSAKLEWPDDELEAIGFKVLLLRRIADGGETPWDFCRYFMHAGSNLNDSVYEFNNQIARPAFEDLANLFIQGLPAAPEDEATKSTDVLSNFTSVEQKADEVYSGDWTGVYTSGQRVEILREVGRGVHTDLGEWIQALDLRGHNRPPDSVIDPKLLENLRALHAGLGDLIQKAESEIEIELAQFDRLSDTAREVISETNVWIKSQASKGLAPTVINSTMLVGLGYFVSAIFGIPLAEAGIFVAGGAAMNAIKKSEKKGPD